jgi:hypothetical protein
MGLRGHMRPELQAFLRAPPKLYCCCHVLLTRLDSQSDRKKAERSIYYPT